MVGGSGANPIPALTGNTIFTGLDSSSTIESNQWHIVPVNMTFRHFYCAGPKSAAGASLTFTVNITTFSGGVASTVSESTTCVIPPGSVSSRNTGTINVLAGQAIDVSVTGGSTIKPTTAGGVSWGLAP